MNLRLIRHMGVSVDVQPNGLNLCCWMSPDDMWGSDTARYPFVHTYQGGECTWFIHSNVQLTLKAYQLCCDTADRICGEQIAKNNTRKLSNR